MDQRAAPAGCSAGQHTGCEHAQGRSNITIIGLTHVKQVPEELESQNLAAKSLQKG